MSNVVPLRRNLRPEDLDLDDALRLVFPGFVPGEGRTPIRAWRAGSRPRVDRTRDEYEGLAELDRIISEGVAARDGGDRKAIKLRSTEELEDRGIACPYFYARLGVAWGVRRARNAHQIHKRRASTRALSQKELANSAEGAAENIDAFLSKYIPYEITELVSPTGKLGHIAKPTIFYENHQKIKSEYIIVAKAHKILRDIAQASLQERKQYIKTGSINIWMSCFITSMGYLWTELTGRTPAPKSEPFAEFLSAGYLAIGGDREVAWSRRIDTSNKASPENLLLDTDVKPVPLEKLLNYEIFTNETICREKSKLISRMIEGDENNPDKAAIKLSECDDLPRPIRALINNIRWSAEEQAAEALGIPLDVVRASLAEVKFSSRLSSPEPSDRACVLSFLSEEDQC